MDGNAMVARSELIAKLVHPLSEVRTRAFRSLITKFNGRLPGWSVAALAMERELLTHIVGWFNDASSARDMQHDMLNLVAAFAEDVEASRTLVELGCVAFFRAYKDDADPEARPRVQTILNALLKVQVKPSPAVTPIASPPRPSNTASPSASDPHVLGGRSLPAPDLALCARIAQYCRTSGTDGCRFPLVSLCAEDEVLLSDLTVRLYRQVPHEAVDACMELEHAVLRDFPPEVVLQRPALFQALVSLVQTPNHINDLTVDRAAISAMTALARSFRRSLKAYDSANLTASSRFCLQEPKFDKVVEDALSGDRPEGTHAGQMYPAIPRSSMGGSGEGLSVSQACRCMVGEVLPLLRDVRRVEPIFRLLREILPLVAVRGLRPATVTQEVDARTVSHYIQSIAKVIGFHGVAASNDPMISHVVMIAVSVLELSPPDTLSEASWPQSILVFMGDLVLNESFCGLHPSFRARVLPYLTALYPPAARRYKVALSVRKQLDCCVALFSRRQTAFVLADLNAVVEASAALRYRCDAELVGNFVLACADLCSIEHADQLELEHVRTVMLAALQSPVVALRGHTYAALHQLVKVRKNGSTRDVASQALVFHPDTMQQLVTFGLHDSHLGAMPADFLREIMSCCTPSELSQLISSSMVAVVAALGGVHSGVVANAVLDIVQQQLDPLAKLKLNISMLFHKEEWVRSEAAAALRSDYPRAVGTADEETAADPFRIGCGYFHVSPIVGDTIRTMFDDSDIGKVIDVFRHSALASQLRRSAAEQLLCVCQDSHACDIVYHHDVWAIIWKDLSTDPTLQVVCLGLIMTVVERLPTARSALSDNTEDMQLLLAFAFHKESKIRVLASRIYALALLQSEVLVPDFIDHTELELAVDAKMRVPGFVEQNFFFCFPIVSSSPSDQSTSLTSPDAGITNWLNATSEEEKIDRIDTIVSTVLAGFGSASSPQESVSHLDQLVQLCSVSDAVIEALLRKDWISCFVRYLQVVPSSLADYGLVSKVLQLVSVVICERSLGTEVLQPLRKCVDHLIGLLGGLTAVLNGLHEGDEPSVGWLHSDLRSPSAEKAKEGEYELVVQRFREAMLRFLANLFRCEQCSFPELPTTAALLMDGSTFLETVCAPRFPGTGPLAFSVRSLALRCLLLVLRCAGECTTSTQVFTCLEFSRSIVCAASLAPERYVDDQLLRVAMDGAGQCLWMLQGSATAVAEEFVASTLEVLHARDTRTRSATLRLLKDIASSAAQTETLKTEWENVVSFCTLGDRMVAIAMDVNERFEVRGEALRLLADALRYSVRMHDGSLHDGVATENTHLTEHGLMSAGLELDTFHRRFLAACVRLLAEPTPPKFAGQLCDVLVWSALAFDRVAFTVFCDESTWRVLLTHLSISSYWTMYTDWQQTTASTLCVPVKSRSQWLEESAQDLAAALSSSLQLMRLMALEEKFLSSVDAVCLRLAVEATVDVLTEVFESKSLFDDDAFVQVNQSSYELLSVLLVRTDEKQATSVKQALRGAVGQTVRTAARTDGSALVNSLTHCLFSAIPDLEIAVCQFLDVAIADASDLLMLHMTSAQCQDLTTALVAAHIEGPLCARKAQGHGNDEQNDARWSLSVRGALGQVLAWSHDAKVAALHAGLLGSIVDRLFALHDSAHLKLRNSKEMASRADSPPSALASITEQLKLLTNFLHHSEEAKAAAADPACIHVQRKLWALQQQWRDSSFTLQLLHVAAASVSHCAESQAQWHQKLLPTEHNADARHILTAVIRLAKQRQVTASVWLAAVETLRNFALIKSARLHMLKEGWLTQCSVLLASIHESERAKEQPAAVALVEFLANFTFAADGQIGCMKVSGMLSGVVRTLAYSHVGAQRAATLAIRNMCFHRANKPHLLADREALPALGRVLSSEDAELRLNAASALWALVYDNQKAKAAVKKLASQGVITLAPGVIDAATKAFDPALAAAAEVGGTEARAAFAMLQVARLSMAV